MSTKKTFRMKAGTVKGDPCGRSLGIGRADRAWLVRLVRKGFRYSRLKKFQKATGLPMEKIAGLTRISPRTLVRRQNEGRLRPDESDRVLRVSRVFDLALDLFEGDVASARLWLETPQAGLGGEVPLELASTEIGAREVEGLITRLEHGVFA